MSTARKVHKQESQIDIDILEKLGRECAISNIASDETMKRFELNALCEILSQFNKLNMVLTETINLLSIAGNDKIVDFFTKTRDNFEKEKARVEAENAEAKKE